MKIAKGWAFPDADEFMLGQLKDDGTYQASHVHDALALVSDFSCAIDGGAHVGTWSRLLSPRFARVLAFEPSADTFEALTANMATFACANVELNNLALGSTRGKVSMTLDGRGAQLKNTGARYTTDGGEVRRITIDSLALPSLGLLKLDVEGSEFAALLGARETLLRCKPVVLFENKGLWRRFGVEPQGPHKFLASLRYRQLQVSGCDLIWGPA